MGRRVQGAPEGHPTWSVSLGGWPRSTQECRSRTELSLNVQVAVSRSPLRAEPGPTATGVTSKKRMRNSGPWKDRKFQVL